jgi:hypothetical protein
MRCHVHGAEPAPAGERRQRVHVEPLVVDRKRGELGARQPERAPDPRIAELLDDDDVARREHRLRDQVQRLLTAAREDQALGVNR